MLEEKAIRVLRVNLIRSRPGISLQRDKGAPEEGIVKDVTLSGLAANHPLALLGIDEAKIGGNRLCMGALSCVYDDRSQSAIQAQHDPPPLRGNIDCTARFINGVKGKRKEIIGASRPISLVVASRRQRGPALNP